MMSYFTAGVLVVLGFVLIIAFTKLNKMFIPAGIVCILLGAWWGFSEAMPEDSAINGWVGTLVKVIAGVTLGALLVVLVFIQKKEREKFKAEMDEKEREDSGPAPLYEKYDDFDYDIKELDDSDEK